MSEAAHTVIGMDHWHAEPLALFDGARVDARRRRVRPRDDRCRRAQRPHRHGARRRARCRGNACSSARDWLADPGVPIPEGATAIHGITTERARAEGRPAREVVAEVLDALRALFDAGIPVVAYNAPYDFSLLKYEALRHGLAPIDAPSPVIDPLVVDKTYDRWRRGKRTLSVVAEHYAVRLDGAHEASADAIAAGRVAQALAERFAPWLPATASELHTRQIAWARAQAASLTEYFIAIGRLDPDDELDGSWPIR